MLSMFLSQPVALSRETLQPLGDETSPAELGHQGQGVERDSWVSGSRPVFPAFCQI